MISCSSRDILGDNTTLSPMPVPFVSSFYTLHSRTCLLLVSVCVLCKYNIISAKWRGYTNLASITHANLVVNFLCNKTSQICFKLKNISRINYTKKNKNKPLFLPVLPKATNNIKARILVVELIFAQCRAHVCAVP